MRAGLVGLIVGVSAALPTSPVAMPVLPTRAASADPSLRHGEFQCSPGFEPRGSACVATLSRDELLVYGVDDRVAPRRHFRRRHGLRELY